MSIYLSKCACVCVCVSIGATRRATDSYLEMGPDGAAPATGDSYLEMSPSGAPGGYLDMTPDDSYLAVTPDQVFQNDAELTGYLEV